MSGKRITVALEHRFYSCDGALYTKLAFPYDYWADYLSYFDSVNIVARVQQVSSVGSGMARVDGPRVSFVPVPHYIGIRQFVIAFPQLVYRLFSIARSENAFILRSGNISNILWLGLILFRRPYLREYPGNVYEGVTGLVGNHFSTRCLAHFLDAVASIQGRFSKANSFVSEYVRDLYSSQRPGFIFSSFRVGELGEPKAYYSTRKDGFRVISVGRLEFEKGHSSLIEAVGEVPGLQLTIVGDGRRRAVLESYDTKKSVDFLGAITDRAELFDLLRRSDLFVLPSLTEGMPRSLLEAMALGLPCIASRVGGIPEILPERCLFSPGSVREIVDLMASLQTNEALRKELGSRNRQFVVEKFGEEKMRSRKVEFWSCVHE